MLYVLENTFGFKLTNVTGMIHSEIGLPEQIPEQIQIHPVMTGTESDTSGHDRSAQRGCPYAHARMHAQVFWIPQPNRKHSFLRAQQTRHNRLGSTALPMQFPTTGRGVPSVLSCVREGMQLLP